MTLLVWRWYSHCNANSSQANATLQNITCARVCSTSQRKLTMRGKKSSSAGVQDQFYFFINAAQNTVELDARILEFQFCRFGYHMSSLALHESRDEAQEFYKQAKVCIAHTSLLSSSMTRPGLCTGQNN